MKILVPTNLWSLIDLFCLFFTFKKPLKNLVEHCFYFEYTNLCEIGLLPKNSH